MKYVVEWKNPNNVVLVEHVYTFETRRKSELNEFLQNARRYSGSYTILSVEKISEAKNRAER